MRDYTKELPSHMGKYVGEHDLFLEVYEAESVSSPSAVKRPPLLFVHGAYSGSWMWAKFIPHFVNAGWECYVMNLRSHYLSRVMDMTRITFEDYLEDIREMIVECGAPPILIGFSMGGILSQKLAESVSLAGLVVIDSSISKEVHDAVPYDESFWFSSSIIVPSPLREEITSLDESAEDIAFQRKYLSMESALAFKAFRGFGTGEGISINGSLITCPSLVVKAVSSEEEDQRGRRTAEQLHAEYMGLWHTTHTGLLVGQRYKEVVDRMQEWLISRFS